MKVIVTGSEGFIGKVLCQELNKRGYEVVGIDRKKGVEATKVVELVRHGGVHCVFHLAAQTSVFNSNIEQIRKDNIDTFIKIVDVCNQCRVKLVYASSSTAYELNTTSMYGITKHFNEQYAKVYCPSATGCRLHNVYGPNQRKKTLLWYLMTKDVVTLYNNGENRRCFTYITDVVEGLIYAMDCDKQLVNIVNPEPMPIRTFAREVQCLREVKIEFSDEIRPLDRAEQQVDSRIFLVPLQYKKVREGLREVMKAEGQKAEIAE